MCGICGKISFDDQPIEKALIKKMCRRFAYRGPDDEGIYVDNTDEEGPLKANIGLGHQRLSIIDLSKAGHQPMSNEDHTVWITFNGEIYNFRELRAELIRKGHGFKSNTDTEVILHLYEEEGLRAVKRLNGMFAFALWDQGKGRLWVCRDRIGIKPLLYYWDGKDFVFASEIKALLCDPSIPKEIDFDALQLYLAFNYIPAPYTIFKGIRKLEPGNYLAVLNGRIKAERYWDTPQTSDPDILPLGFAAQEKFFKKKLYEGLSDSVKARMIADVPLGAFLSGGIDSSIIVALMARHSGQAIQTFSIGFEGAQLFDETAYAREVAGLYKTDHHEFKLTYRDMLDIFSEVLSTFDEPFADSSAIPTFIVSRETRKYVTVALSGDGGDELFAGYRSYLGEYWYKRYLMIPAIFRKYLLEKLILALPDSRNIRFLEYIRRLKKFIRSTRGDFAERMLSLKEIAPGDVRRKLIQNCNSVNEELILTRVGQRLNTYKDDRINTILYSDLKDSLPGDMLNKVDWMSMKNSLEVRVPFLDHHMVELAFRMPGTLKLNRGKTKYILKETFKEILPKSLYRRPKAGFEIPISQWLKTDLKFLLKDYLDEGRIRKQGIFDQDTIAGLIEAQRTNRTDSSWMLWNLIVFQYWYDTYFK